MSVAEWLRKIGEAADELGYDIEELRAEGMTVRPHGRGEWIIRIESERGFLPITAETLRLLLAPQDPKR